MAEDKALDSAGCSDCPVAGILAPIQSQGDSWWARSPLKSNLSKAVEEGQHRWGHGRPTLNEDTLPEDSANMCPPEEHQIRKDEHCSGEGREKGNATPFHCRRDFLLNNGLNKG